MRCLREGAEDADFVAVFEGGADGHDCDGDRCVDWGYISEVAERFIVDVRGLRLG